MTALNPEDRKIERDRARRRMRNTLIDLVTSIFYSESRSEREWRELLAQSAQDSADAIDRDIQDMNRQHQLWQQHMRQQFRQQFRQQSKHNGSEWV